MVRVVPAVVAKTMASKAVYLPAAPSDTVLTAPVIATTVAVPVPALTTAPMAAVVFAVTPAAPVLTSPSVAAHVTLPAPSVVPSLSDAIA